MDPRQMDSVRWAGVLTVGAVALLALLRRGFAGVSVRVGD